MLLPSLGSGFTSARRHLRLAIVFWLASLLLALPTTVAFFAWWSNALQYTPGADVLLGRMDLGVLIDMVEEGQVVAWNLLFAALLTTALVALVVNAFLAGGVLELLVAARAQRHSHEPREPRSFSHRFFRGAGHFFWGSLALLVLTLIAAGAVVAAVSAGLRFALKPFETSLGRSVLSAPVSYWPRIKGEFEEVEQRGDVRVRLAGVSPGGQLCRDQGSAGDVFGSRVARGEGQNLRGKRH